MSANNIGYSARIVNKAIASTTTKMNTAPMLYSFPTKLQQRRFDYLLHNLRCLVCQNENLADSQATLAADIRQKIYVMVLAGNNIREVERYFIARYGDFVLLKPRVNHLTFVLWYAPLLMLILGFIWMITINNKRMDEC